MLGIQEEETMTELPTTFNRWVNDNNPPVNLEYGKGWWDYIEILQRLIDKFAVTEIGRIEFAGFHAPMFPDVVSPRQSF
jgi:hypothetical protein